MAPQWMHDKADAMTDEVSPRQARPAVLKIFRNYGMPKDPVEKAVLLHRFVRKRISYVDDPETDDYFSSPQEVLSLETGDCDCQTILLASMFRAADLEVNNAIVHNGDGGVHALSLVKLPETHGISDLRDVYRGFYFEEVENVERIDLGSYSGGSVWYFADPLMSKYVGDADLLRNKGYAGAIIGRHGEVAFSRVY